MVAIGKFDTSQKADKSHKKIGNGEICNKKNVGRA